jgi:hypothetical protein
MILLSSPPLTRTLPSKENSTVLTQALQFSQTSGNIYVKVVYASPPLSGEAKTVNYNGFGRQRKMQSPVALELLELLARSHIPQPNTVVAIKSIAAA